MSDERMQEETQRDPVIFGTDPFTHERPPIEDEDKPTYRPPTRWAFIIVALFVVVLLVGAVGLWVL
jgi:hypothetical protein